MIGDKLSFVIHVEYACKIASTAIAALLKTISNSFALIARKRNLLASVALFILRYRGPIWSKALRMNRNLNRLEDTYRIMCLKVPSAYRTVYGEEDVQRRACKETTLKGRRQKWDNSIKGRWTRRLIPNVSD